MDQGGQLRYFKYDSLSWLIRAKKNEQDVNASLNLSDSVTGNSAWTLKYIYDDINRNYAVSYTGGSVATPVVERYYDSATLGKGRLWRTISYNAHPVNTAQAAYQYNEITAYDALGRPINGGQWFLNSSSQWVTYPYSRSYDSVSHVTGQTYPSNRTVSYSYGGDGRLSSFSGNLGDGVPLDMEQPAGHDGRQLESRGPLYLLQRDRKQTSRARY